MLSKKKILLLILPFILFIGSLTVQLIVFFNTTSRVEPVSFPSVLDESQSTVGFTSGNLFYPKNYDPSQKYPVVIIVHGFEVTKTTDLRLATELTKRGIFALPIDLAGHGHTSGTLGPYFWKHAIGALDWVYSRPDLFNLSAVGMCGHSLGGWTTFLAMGYEAGRLDRINACVTWAGVFNTSSMLEASEGGDAAFGGILAHLKVDTNLFDNLSYQFDHNPINYYNGSLGATPTPDAYGPRILVIHGTDDGTVPYSNAIDANNSLGANMSLYTLPGGDHLLIDTGDEVVYQTILHFEHHFFGINPSSNDLSISSFSYLSYYVCFLLTLVGLVFSILSLIFILWYKKVFKREQPVESEPRGLKFVIITTLPYIGLSYAIYGLQQILYNLYLSLLIGSSFFFAYTLTLLLYLNRKSLNKTTIWNTIRSNTRRGSVLIGFHLGLLAILGYLILAYSFGLFVFSPLSIEYLILAIIGMYPFVLANEIFLRKVIQENLHIPVKYLKNRWVKRIVMAFLTLLLTGFFVYLVFVIFLAYVAMLVGFVVATLTGVFLYEKYPSLSATTIFITIITATLTANCYFFFI